MADGMPAKTLRYGAAPSQIVELFLPEGRGPHPVVAFIHGGCYRSDVANLADLRPTYAALAKSGIAVWGIGYRRTDETGGAYPGMFQDVGAALDLLGSQGRKHRLDLRRAVVAGHSAGGHLALWTAGRRGIAAGSALHVRKPFPRRPVVAIAAPGDLRPLEQSADKTCGPGVFGKIVGQKTASRPDVFADTSPASMLPFGVKLHLIVGAEDKLVPPAMVDGFARSAKGSGDDVSVTVIPGADHFAVVRPGHPAFAVVRDAILEASRE